MPVTGIRSGAAMIFIGGYPKKRCAYVFAIVSL